MKTVNSKQFENHGYIWGPNTNLFERSWLQFADDTALIAHNVKSAQTLIDINVAWCNWTGMQLRIDKCQSFGMRKIDGSYEQFLPNLSIGDENISAVKLNESFKYLGKLFNAHMNNAEAKVIVQNKLDSLLVKTTKLNLKPQLKLKILKLYISNQLKLWSQNQWFFFHVDHKQFGCSDTQTRCKMVRYTDQHMCGSIPRIT